MLLFFRVVFSCCIRKNTLNNVRTYTAILRTHATRTRCGELPGGALLATCRARARVDAYARTAFEKIVKITKEGEQHQ